MNDEIRDTSNEQRNTNEPPHELSGLSTLGHVTRHLHSHPDLVDVLVKVFESDAFMITLSWLEQTEANQPARIQHHFKMDSFNPADVVPSLQHLIRWCQEQGYGLTESSIINHQ